MRKKVALKAKRLEKELPGKVRYGTAVISDTAGKCITEAVANYNADLLIMGSRGTTNLVEKLFGSVTAYMLRHTSVPMMVIPQEYKYKPVEKVVIGCERLEAFSRPIVDGIKMVADMFNARLVLFWLLNHEKYTQARAEEKLLQREMRTDADVPEFRFDLTHDSVEEGIDEFAIREDVDLVVVLPQERNFLDRILHGSVTKRLAVRTHKPMLVFPPKINMAKVRRAFEIQPAVEIESWTL
jgi:nucleotide-binding universal stress UspA family protein